MHKFFTKMMANFQFFSSLITNETHRYFRPKFMPYTINWPEIKFEE